jgi:hypothetical protein
MGDSEQIAKFVPEGEEIPVENLASVQVVKPAELQVIYRDRVQIKEVTLVEDPDETEQSFQRASRELLVAYRDEKKARHQVQQVETRLEGAKLALNQIVQIRQAAEQAILHLKTDLEAPE